MTHAKFEVGDLTAVIGSNASFQGESLKQRQGYNGLWSLTHKTGSRNLFVPGIAGLNFEHIISGEGEHDRDIFFEPRRTEMDFTKLSDSKAELHQLPTPSFHLESWTYFELKPPHYIDMKFQCRAAQHLFPHGYIGLFWASYINAPLDKSMYFLGGLDGRGQDEWCQLCTPAHNHHSTVRHRDDTYEMKFAEGAPNALYKNFSPLRFDTPLFYGNFENHVLIVMFDRTKGIRLTHSPSGGGLNRARNTTNPAWDFQFIISPWDVIIRYELNVRVIFRETCTRDEILNEYSNWQAQA